MDVTPLSLGIETLGGVMTRLIDRNTTIPTRRSEVFSTAADNQPAVEVHVLQGEREFAKDNVTLGQFHLVGIPAAPRGIPQIEVTFDIDANGIVNVTAKDLGTGTEQSVKIESQTSLSEEDIQKKINEAEEFAEEDKRRKARVDLRNQADSIVYQTRKTLDEADDKLEDSETSEIKTLLEDLESLIRKDDQLIDIEEIDEAAIQSKVSEIESAMHGISTKLYEAAASAVSEEQSNADCSSINIEDYVVDGDYEVIDETD